MTSLNGAGSTSRKRTFDHGEDESPSGKKVRFDARNPSTLAAEEDEEDAVLDIDEIGKRGRHTKRKAVQIEGYDSDSDQDNFNARAAAKAKADKEAQTGGDIDMFADAAKDGEDEDVENISHRKKKDKEVRFLNEDEIEGQEQNSKAGGHVGSIADPDEDEAESSSESGDDEDRDHVPESLDKELGAGAKKKHAPRLDAFNMRNESEEGRFDEHGNFVRKAADPDAKYDEWLVGISKKDMKKAAEAKAKREEENRKKAMAADAVLTSEHLKTVLTHVRKGETPAEAFARLQEGRLGIQRRPSTSANQNTANLTQVIDELSEAITQLIGRGQTNAFEDERERFARRYKEETGDDWIDDPEQWEFRWATDSEGKVYGPHSSEEMQAWKDEYYFDDYAAQFRRVGDEKWSWKAEFL